MLTHDAPGRVRYRIAARRGDPAFFARIGKELLKCEMVQTVEINPLTGSILVLHAAQPAEITHYAEQHGLFRLGGEPLVPSADKPAPDALGLLPPLFIGLGLYQLLQGNVLAPAVTLFWYAFSLMNTNSGHATPETGAQVPVAKPARTGSGRKTKQQYQQQGDSDG
jgi:hypothetical protein